MKHARRKRIALFVESHEGYGHFNIVSQLARKLEDEGAEVMVLSGTLNYAGAAQTFNFKDARIVHLPLVDYRILRGGKWEFTTADAQIYAESPDAIKQRQQVVTDAIRDFKPDAIVTEFFPFQQSFRDYDMEAIEALYPDKAKRPETIALCRDIIHSVAPKRVMASLERHYDRILVRGDAGFSTLAQSQKEWADITQPVEYMGNYITAMPSRDAAVKGKDRHVVVFGGGGYYDRDLPFFESIIRARAHSVQFGNQIWDIYLSENTKKHMVPDPNNPEKTITALDYITRIASDEGHGMIRVFEPIDSKKFREELANASVAITRGGYNTTFELFAAKTPQLVIPRSTQEQVQRANALYSNGMAQIYPEFPIEESRDIAKALKDVAMLARAIDTCPQIEATAPKLNNHGAETTARRILELLREKEPPKLTLLIAYQDTKQKHHDTLELARHLREEGHHVTLVDSAKLRVVEGKKRSKLLYKDEELDLAAFDAATLRTPVEVAQTKILSEALAQAGVPVYQDYPMLAVAGDKCLSHAQFKAHDVPTPATWGCMHGTIPKPSEVSAFLDDLGAPPYVVKASRGWSGKQVAIVDTKPEAVEAFNAFHKEARKAKSGGALIQAFIESDPERRCDYRIQTVLTYDAKGVPEVEIVAAAKRRAQSGMRITNVSKGADKIRVALSERDAHDFHVEKGKMSEDRFAALRAQGDIEVLSDAVREAATKAALAFGSGSLGVDVVVDKDTGRASVIEVNPFAGGSRNFEEEQGFAIYKHWADGFAAFAAAHKRGAAPTEALPAMPQAPGHKARG